MGGGFLKTLNATVDIVSFFGSDLSSFFTSSPNFGFASLFLWTSFFDGEPTVIGGPNNLNAISLALGCLESFRSGWEFSSTFICCDILILLWGESSSVLRFSGDFFIEGDLNMLDRDSVFSGCLFSGFMLGEPSCWGNFLILFLGEFSL